MTQITRCRIERCPHRFYGGFVYPLDHEAQRHYVCSCGNVGVEFSKHIGQIRRHQRDVAAHRLTALVRLKARQR